MCMHLNNNDKGEMKKNRLRELQGEWTTSAEASTATTTTTIAKATRATKL